MTMPYYASAEQIMRDRSELARKGIARGRSVIVLTFADGVLFVAENRSTALHKVSELYDRLGFAAVGKYNEFESLRKAGILHADTKGYTYDRRDVTGRSLAKTYAQALGTIFTEQLKPYEVEICVAEVSHSDEAPSTQLYRITYDGSIVDEQDFVVMGGTTEPIVTALRESYRPGLDLASAVKIAVAALSDGAGAGSGATAGGSADGEKKVLEVSSLEVAVLDQARPRRAFRRIAGPALEDLLPA
ncbi:proteasome subunit alpha [Rhodococcus sp. BP-252]|uniref:Proteasome subunit alpha n=1 Tax=Rhodococcoides kyotonense TaxID=398843 RepID=A0A177YFH1_9NOCA|nr:MULTISPECIES: proteasome subunit alpha [Rhodococcus]MBY6410069.1 proteasome subunit alpha [Rhodococcus sp. BP-320]MBY6415038.1 proteasome subunit alpha [Rhodococcus sp. BP-321]MBY6421259.1 proteasome subunit alpha [Rhodococcus sp. BP-324]MBY6425654.1 proteasome subunit alpha [Rhodococcus sp. BP-323]MBY6429934.1 proteasome subunit alpha [Rhodococcus sp. BP-322]